ncbi:hypothetical protein Moror_13030 [Moniliophthora roreri MCA 2997]|uniref:MYND-type domain-containing protein n=1 Tax=Moniliophthora roreri (strain MCA 2997) TaxID=1381753 RepID=V2XJD7_MONRO|nr:hypothetical protein Moror_13030 [Moniliophthora roreri MCA 2997]
MLNRPLLDRLKSEAWSGSPEALLQLQGIMSENEGNAKLVLEILPIIWAHLPLPIPSFNTTTDSNREHVTKHAANALAALPAAFQCGAFRTKKVTTEIQRNWSRIWSWITFLYDSYLNSSSPTRYTSTHLDQIHLALSAILSASTSFPCLISLCAKTQSFAPLATDIALLMIQNPRFTASEPVLIHSSLVLQNVSKVKHGSSDQLVRRLNQVESQHLADIIVTRIMNARSALQPHSHLIPVKVSLIVLYCCSISSPIFNAWLMNCRSVYWVCHTMKRLLSFETRRLDGALLADCLQLSFTYLMTAFNQYGHTVVLEALRARLLQSMASTSSLFGVDALLDATLMELYTDLLRVIGQYTMYRSVCGVASKALSHVAHKVPSGTKLARIFRGFESTVQERMELRRCYDTLEIGMCANRCSYRTTHIRAKNERITFYRCGGCRAVFYCSKTCQGEDWKQGHKDMCAVTKTRMGRGSNDYLPPCADIRDVMFMDWMIEQHLDDEQLLHTHITRQNEYRNQHPEIRASDLVVSVLDFTGFPFEISVTTMADAKEKCPDTDWDLMLHQAEGETGQMLLVLTVGPCTRGYTNSYTFMMPHKCTCHLRGQNAKVAEARLKHLKSSALAGSRNALQDIETMISENLRIVPDVLPAILHHLPAPLPDFSAMDIPQKTSIIGLAQSALVALGEALIRDHFHTQSVVDEIHRSWPHIWRWIVFLFDSYLNPESDLYASSVPIDDMVDHPVTIHYAISKIIFAFTNSKVTGLPILTKTKGAISLAIENFLISAGELSFVLMDRVMFNPDAFTYSTWALLGLMEAPDDKPLQAIANKLSQKKSGRFAVGIVARLIFASRIQDASGTPRSLKSTLNVMNLLTLYSPAFNISLIHSKSVYWVCTIIRGLTSRLGATVSSDSANVLKSGCDYLLSALDHFGHPVATELLKTGLLKCILKSGRFLDSAFMIESISEDSDETKSTGTLPELYIKLLHKIGSYTVYGSVCGVAVKALSRVKMLEPPPRLAEEFKQFVTEVEGRAKSKAKHDESAIAVCGRIGCPYLDKNFSDRTKGDRVPTFRCTGCEEVYYCSKECQKFDWVERGHRNMCKQRKLSKERNSHHYNGPTLDIRDLLSFNSMIMDYIEDDVAWWLSVALLFKVRCERDPDIQPDEPLVALLNYQEFPHKMDIITVRKAKGMDTGYSWDRVVANWRRRGEFVPILTIAPSPGRPDYAIWTWPLNEMNELDE